MTPSRPPSTWAWTPPRRGLRSGRLAVVLVACLASLLAAGVLLRRSTASLSTREQSSDMVVRLRIRSLQFRAAQQSGRPIPEAGGATGRRLHPTGGHADPNPDSSAANSVELLALIQASASNASDWLGSRLKSDLQERCELGMVKGLAAHGGQVAILLLSPQPPRHLELWTRWVEASRSRLPAGLLRAPGAACLVQCPPGISAAADEAGRREGACVRECRASAALYHPRCREALRDWVRGLEESGRAGGSGAGRDLKKARDQMSDSEAGPQIARLSPDALTQARARSEQAFQEDASLLAASPLWSLYGVSSSRRAQRLPDELPSTVASLVRPDAQLRHLLALAASNPLARRVLIVENDAAPLVGPLTLWAALNRNGGEDALNELATIPDAVPADSISGSPKTLDPRLLNPACWSRLALGLEVAMQAVRDRDLEAQLWKSCAVALATPATAAQARRGVHVSAQGLLQERRGCAVDEREGAFLEASLDGERFVDASQWPMRELTLQEAHEVGPRAAAPRHAVCAPLARGFGTGTASFLLRALRRCGSGLGVLPCDPGQDDRDGVWWR